MTSQKPRKRESEASGVQRKEKPLCFLFSSEDKDSYHTAVLGLGRPSSRSRQLSRTSSRERRKRKKRTRGKLARLRIHCFTLLSSVSVTTKWCQLDTRSEVGEMWLIADRCKPTFKRNFSYSAIKSILVYCQSTQLHHLSYSGRESRQVT